MRLHTIKCMLGKPDRQYVMGQILYKMREDPDPTWAQVFWDLETNRQQLTEVAVEGLILLAKEEEDRAVCLVRKARSDSFHQWATAETKGSLKQVCRWIREGPRLPSEYGLYTTAEGEVLAGEPGLIRAVDAAWWPLWKQGRGRLSSKPLEVEKCRF